VAITAQTAARDNVEGLIIGSLVGDALGVPVEFLCREELIGNPVTDMLAFGTHNQPKGTWSDDGSLMLISLETLLNKEPPVEALRKFVRWVDEGYWTPHGRCFDIGNTTSEAIAGFIQHGKPHAPSSPRSNGNGALMRIAPVVLFVDNVHDKVEDVYEVCKEWSALTHGHETSAFCCLFYTVMLGVALGTSKGRPARNDKWILADAYKFACSLTKKFAPEECARLVSGNLGNLPENEIMSSGYVVHTLEASTWAALNSDGYREGVLKAVNLGEDTDTTGCVCGGLLGAAYGRSSIPAEWVQSLARLQDIENLIAKI
jgi:ADP-ribosyl-[dinitrogen reductase] hydrolase